jgi:hypothetical protein
VSEKLAIFLTKANLKKWIRQAQIVLNRRNDPNFWVQSWTFRHISVFLPLRFKSKSFVGQVFREPLGDREQVDTRYGSFLYVLDLRGPNLY